MIQCINGMIMLKGNYSEILTDLSQIVMSLENKKFDHEDIVNAIAAGVCLAHDEHASEMMEVVLDKTLDENDNEVHLKDEKPISNDTFKKMFGEFFNE